MINDYELHSDSTFVWKLLEVDDLLVVAIVGDWSDGHHVAVESKDLQLVIKDPSYEEYYKDEAKIDETR